MPYALRTHTCPDCGIKHERRGPANPPMPCHACSIQRAAEAARQMHAKSGPYWDTWVFRHANAARQLAASHQVNRARRAS